MGLFRSVRPTRPATEPVLGKYPMAEPSEAVSLLVSLAAAHDEAGRHAEALAMLQPALQASPNEIDLIVARASSLYAAGRYREARDVCLRTMALGQGHAGFHRVLGWACLRTSRIVDAESEMRKAVELEPQSWIVTFAMGTVLRAMRRYAEAEEFFRRAVDLQPSSAPSLINLGACHLDRGNLIAAEAMMRRALEVDAKSASAWNNLGLILIRQERLEEGVDAHRRAEQLECDTGADAVNFLNFGVALRESGDTQAALDVYESRLPDYPGATAHTQYALALLAAGRLREGWSHMEFRWLIEPLNLDRSRSGRPVWCGQDLRGKTILLRVEQGFGDTIQFLRYAPALKALGATVCLGVAPGFGRVADLFPGVDKVFGSGSTIDYDYQIPVISLARVMGTEIDSIPAAIPYLHAAAVDIENWAPRFSRDGMLKVGLSWAGSPEHVRDRQRSIALPQLSELSDVGGVTFYSLQKGSAADEVASGALPLVDLGPELLDFCDTAAVIEHLDLVICVDTAVAHLAGALGKPVWLMLPRPADWRWLEGRDDTPWYPTMRLFRQRKHGDWADVIRRIKAELRDLVERPLCNARSALGKPPSRPARSEQIALSRQGAAPGIRPGFCGAAETRVGILQFRPDDDPVGKSLDWYGEYLQPQLDLLGRIVRPGSTVLEVGAGIGVHAVFLARLLGPEGHLLVSEARSVPQRILGQNLPANGAGNVTLLRPMVGEQQGTADVAEPVDGLQLERLDLLKVGEGIDGAAVLAGAREVLWRLRPLLFTAAENVTNLDTLAGHARTFGYRCWKMSVRLFNSDNFNRRDNDIFDGRVALALLAVPEEIDVEVVLDHCVEMS